MTLRIPDNNQYFKSWKPEITGLRSLPIHSIYWLRYLQKRRLNAILDFARVERSFCFSQSVSANVNKTIDLLQLKFIFTLP